MFCFVVLKTLGQLPTHPGIHKYAPVPFIDFLLFLHDIQQLTKFEYIEEFAEESNYFKYAEFHSSPVPLRHRQIVRAKRLLQLIIKSKT